jgi:hypothetical protein
VKGTGNWGYATQIKFLSPGLELNDLGYMQTADQVDQLNEISYLINHPVSIFNSYDISLELFTSWNFNGRYPGSGAHFIFGSQFINRWSTQLNLIYHFQTLDTRILRGGYDMLIPDRFLFFGQLGSDFGKKVAFGFYYNVMKNVENRVPNMSMLLGFRCGPPIHYK